VLEFDKIQSHLNAATDPETEEHRLFPSDDWRYQVDNGDTNQGFDDWLENEIMLEVENVVDAIQDFMRRAVDICAHNISEVDFNRDILDTFSTLRIYDDEAVDRAAKSLRKRSDPPIFGETFGSVPPDLAFDLSRLAQLGMSYFEGAVECTELQNAVVEICQTHEIEGSAIVEAKRLLSEDGPSS